MLHIVLHEPEMPANTGNIGRTCVACGAVLHLIEPLGFRLNEKMIKRAGLDYWDKLDVRTYINFEDFLEKNNDPKIYMATTKAKHVYSAPAYEDDEDVYIMFGKESAGIPEEILLNYEETSIRIPMLPHIRSLNLSNSVAIVAYEVLRHQGFKAFQMEGQLHHYKWQDFLLPLGLLKKELQSRILSYDPSGKYFNKLSMMCGMMRIRIVYIKKQQRRRDLEYEIRKDKKKYGKRK